MTTTLPDTVKPGSIEAWHLGVNGHFYFITTTAGALFMNVYDPVSATLSADMRLKLAGTEQETFMQCHDIRVKLMHGRWRLYPASDTSLVLEVSAGVHWLGLTIDLDSLDCSRLAPITHPGQWEAETCPSLGMVNPATGHYFLFDFAGSDGDELTLFEYDEFSNEAVCLHSEFLLEMPCGRPNRLMTHEPLTGIAHFLFDNHLLFSFDCAQMKQVREPIKVPLDGTVWKQLYVDSAGQLVLFGDESQVLIYPTGVNPSPIDCGLVAEPGPFWSSLKPRDTIQTLSDGRLAKLCLDQEAGYTVRSFELLGLSEL